MLLLIIAALCGLIRTSFTLIVDSFEIHEPRQHVFVDQERVTITLGKLPDVNGKFCIEVEQLNWFVLWKGIGTYCDGRAAKDLSFEDISFNLPKIDGNDRKIRFKAFIKENGRKMNLRTSKTFLFYRYRDIVDEVSIEKLTPVKFQNARMAHLKVRLNVVPRSTVLGLRFVDAVTRKTLGEKTLGKANEEKTIRVTQMVSFSTESVIIQVVHRRGWFSSRLVLFTTKTFSVNSEYCRDKLRRYSVMEEIGTGATGVVRKGFDNCLRCYVALKMPYDHCKGMAKREASILISFRNKPEDVNIVNLLDIVEDKGKVLYLVTDLFEGQVTIGKVQDFQDIKNLGRDILKALAYFHSRGYVHRDVKPENILYKTLPDGTRKYFLADFGISCWTSVRMKAGSLDYMAPEASGLDNPFHLYTYAYDIYSFGVTFKNIVFGFPVGKYSITMYEPNEVSIDLNQKRLLAIFVERCMTDSLFRPSANALLNDPFFKQE